jgi:hypothetical protein
MNELLNPEVAKKTNNMRVTQISEYSNAKHNNTVRVLSLISEGFHKS